jgi:3-hydroxyacyl-[acyl-carrier-protein] dehydratase
VSDLTPAEVLALVPQQRPMRFIDEIVELDEEHIIGVYTWKDEDAEGHFPGNPVIPGVKLIEMCAQVGNVAWCIWHMAAKTSAAEFGQMVGFFTEIESGKFLKIVRPGETVACQASFGESGYFRNNKLVAEVEIQFMGGPKDGETIFVGKTGGMFVIKTSENQK